MIDPRLQTVVTSQPYPLLFATISGSHLYGFSSHDSDNDLRGVHILPVREVIGLYDARETVEVTEVRNGLEIDLVTYDVKKFFTLLLKKNGYVLEQLYSHLVVYTIPEHEELKGIARQCITRHHAYHYLGFADNQWKLFSKEQPRRAKPLLYTYRILLTGIHLMHTGAVESNLIHLNEEFRLPYIPDLIARKQSGSEQSVLEDVDLAFYQKEFDRLRRELVHAAEVSPLTDVPPTKSTLNELLLRLRLRQLS